MPSFEVVHVDNVQPIELSLTQKLDRLATLTEEEREAVRSLPVQKLDIDAHQDVIRQGGRASRFFYILSGLMCAYKTTAIGKRQIVAVHIPGDAPDLQGLHLKVMDVGIATLTPCRLALVQHEDLRQLYRRQPRLVDILWRQTLTDAAICREWVTSVGQRSALERMAHFICEMITRHSAVGLVRDIKRNPSIKLPLTQAQLGDALGLSAVHVNRCLQALREKSFISWKSGNLTVLDWPRLKTAGDFDPIYLHLDIDD